MNWPRLRSHHDKIFINYRRDDARGFAGRLADTLAGYFGSGRIFRDVTSIDYGDDFDVTISEVLKETAAMVVLIGDNWATALNEEGGRRLDDPGDFVSREIVAALNKTEITVIPVLIGGVSMPHEDELPDSIKGLARKNAISVSDERWDSDVTRLAKVLSIDLPSSVSQRALDRAKWASIVALVLTMIYATVEFIAALGCWKGIAFEQAVIDRRGCVAGLRASGFEPIEAALPYIALLIAGGLAFKVAPLMESAKRRYAWGIVGLVIVGVSGPFWYYAKFNEPHPDWSLVVAYGTSVLVSVGVLALMALARYKAE